MTRKEIEYTSWGTKYFLSFEKTTYRNNGSLAIQIMCREPHEEWKEPFCMLTVNLAFEPDEGCAFIDTNNCPADLVQKLIEDNIMTPTGLDQMSGYCIYPCCEFNAEWLKSFDEPEEEEEDVFTPSSEDLKEWQDASCGKC